VEHDAEPRNSKSCE